MRLVTVRTIATLTNINKEFNYFYDLKRIAVILMMLIYGTTTVGATVHLHYCMDKFISWDLNETENKTCGKCGMKESATKKGCCKDEIKQLKIDTDHQKSTVESFIKIFQSPAIKYATFLLAFNNVVFDINANAKVYAPPLLPLPEKRTILYCTYRI